MPKFWEDRATLFLTNLIEKGAQSCSVRTYVSAIKKTLISDNYKWDDNKVMLNALTKACRLVNDSVKMRLPISCSLLESILFEIQRIYNRQPFLEKMYKALFALAYYGFFQISELVGVHAMKACNIHMAMNKEKLLVILYSSKTHHEGCHP